MMLIWRCNLALRRFETWFRAFVGGKNWLHKRVVAWWKWRVGKSKGYVAWFFDIVYGDECFIGRGREGELREIATF